MSMLHKAFAFDWNAFDSELAPILLPALDADAGTDLAKFIDQKLGWLTDPYNGDPLPADWRSMLENGDVQELADFALTRYYNVQEDRGIGPAWLGLSESLSVAQSAALLGTPFGVGDRLLDPGRLGSYFQLPSLIGRSLVVLAELATEELQPFRELLKLCTDKRLGVYVTF